MIALGIVVAAIAAFIASSVYYAVFTPVERRVLGDAAIDRGTPPVWKVLVELARTAVVAGALASIGAAADLQSVGGGLLLAGVLWIGFPVVLLTGSMLWERTAAFTAAMHAGDWLLKLVLIAVAVGLLH